MIFSLSENQEKAFGENKVLNNVNFLINEGKGCCNPGINGLK